MNHRFLFVLAAVLVLAPVALLAQSDHPSGCT